jgi:hypothetical protein
MRVAEGAVGRLRNGGWLHRHVDSGKAPRVWRTSVRMNVGGLPRQDFAGLAARFQAAADRASLEGLARELGLRVDALLAFGAGWCAGKSAWSFPMSNALGLVTGIRLRSRTGRKFALTGSREGLFLAADPGGDGPLLICEGATDAAAMFGLGLQAIGRASCAGAKNQAAAFVRRVQADRVVVVADNDRPGRDGAAALAGRLVADCRWVRVLYPPGGLKDAREWVRAGATRKEVLDAIEAAEPHRYRLVITEGLPSAREVRHGR